MMDKKRHKMTSKNKSTSKAKLSSFFFRAFTIYRSLKTTLQRQQRKGTPANTLTKYDFEDRKYHWLRTARSSINWKNIDKRNPIRNISLQCFTIKHRALKIGKRENRLVGIRRGADQNWVGFAKSRRRELPEGGDRKQASYMGFQR